MCEGPSGECLAAGCFLFVNEIAHGAECYPPSVSTVEKGAGGIRVDFVGSMEKPVLLSDGSIRIPARLARAGVQVYTDKASGRTFREYRPADVLFRADAVAAWTSLGVAIKHPPGLELTPKNWREHAVGHVGAASRDGNYLVAPLVISDAATLQEIADGKIIETSAAYSVKIDPTPGTTPDGEHYDQRVVSMVPNHVGIGPEGWGRGGPDVRMMVGDDALTPRSEVAFSDASENNHGRECYPRIMTPEQIKALEDRATSAEARATAAASALDVANARADALAATRPAAASPATQTVEMVADGAEFQRLVNERVTLHENVRRIDSAIALVDAAGKPRTPRELRVEAIGEVYTGFRADGKSDAYVEAYFDVMLATKTPAREVRHEAIRSMIAGQRDPATARADGGDADPVEAARLKSLERGRTAFAAKH